MREFNKPLDMEKEIRSVKDKKTYPLDGVNVSSWRSKVSQLNKEDGYVHYSVAVNTALGIFGIINNGGKQD